MILVVSIALSFGLMAILAHRLKLLAGAGVLILAGDGDFWSRFGAQSSLQFAEVMKLFEN